MEDLSHPFEDGLQTFPADDAVRVRPDSRHDTDGYRSTRIETGSHAGTHVDAPAHILPDGRELAEFEVEAFVLDAIRVDCRDLGDRDPIPVDRVPEDPSADCVVFHTGWDEYWGTERYFDHPYVSPGAAERCAELDYAVGSDTLNPDPTPSPSATSTEPHGYPAHEAILGAGNLIFENLTGLDRMTDRFELRAHPLPLQVDGAPVRAVGVDS
jgi:kynurenine formamidase